MRSFRPLPALLAISLLVSLVATGGTFASAQTTEQAEDAANQAKERAEATSGLVDDAVANREEIERKLTESITRMNDLAAQLSLVGSNLDRVAAQVGYADVELAGIQSDIESQAVDAYMTVVASPSVTVVNTTTVEKALVASSVVEDVVADGRETVGQLFAKRKSLEALQETFLADQEAYLDLQEQVDSEVANYTSLYEEADAEVATAIRDAEAAEREYLAALSAIDLAKAKDDERARQENRESSTPSTNPPTTTSPANPTTTEGSTPSTGGATTTTAPPPTTTSTSGGGGSWNHPPQVEQWRSLVETFFPTQRVEEALRIIDCESNGDPNAVNPYSGAAGLFQFLPSTWASTSPKAGYGGYAVTDPEANVATAAWLANRYQELGQYYWQAWSCRRVLS